MDQAAVLLGALRGRAWLGASRLAAAESARVAEQVLAARPPPDAPEEQRRSWDARARKAMSDFLLRVPGADAIGNLAERALKALGRG